MRALGSSGGLRAQGVSVVQAGAAAATGWEDAGSVVRLVTAADTVAIGASGMSASAEKVRIVHTTPVCLALETSDAGTAGATIETYHNSPSPLERVGATPGDDLFLLKMYANSATGVKREYARLLVNLDTNDNGAERSRLEVNLIAAGTLKKVGGWTNSGFGNTGNLGAGFGPEMNVSLDLGSGGGGVGATGNDAGYFSFYGMDSAQTLPGTLYAYLTGHVDDATNGSEDGSLRVNLLVAGVDTLLTTTDAQGFKVAGSRGYYMNGTKVLGVQAAAQADATDAATVLSGHNALLAKLRTHGILAT